MFILITYWEIVILNSIQNFEFPSSLFYVWKLTVIYIPFLLGILFVMVKINRQLTSLSLGMKELTS